MQDLRLDERTWATASAARRDEWRVILEDLLCDVQVAPHLVGTYGLVTRTADAIVLELLDEEGVTKETASFPHALLRPHVDEYLAIIRRLDEGAGHRDEAWVIAVDMAKKVVHDGAAKTIVTAAPQLGADHPTGRHLFTLIVALVTDTSRLAHAHGHRRG